jgi:hypothetical protein
MTLITEIQKIYPRVHLEAQKTMNSQGNTGQKEQQWRHHNTYLQIILRAIAIKTAWYWHKNRYEEQWSRIEDLEMNPHGYAHLVFDKAAQNM